VRSIRSFLNTDTPALAKIWNSHHQSVQSLAACPLSVWDSCILSKPFFRADELCVATDDLGHLVGFVHFGFIGDSSLQTISQTDAAIHKICIVPGPGEDQVAFELIAHALDQLQRRGAVSALAIGAGDRSAYYLGIGDGDNLMGVLAKDTKTQRWLTSAGFVPVRPTECWELELLSFRPPMDRLQIQARRTCTIGRMLDEDYEHWWTSTVLGHCEQIRFHLMLKNPATLSGLLTCWFPEPSLVGVDSSIVRLLLPDAPEIEDSREQFVYLVAESLRQLQQDRKRLVRAVVSADQQQSINLLQRLGFRSVEHGLLFEKRFP
jgi:hypothetical protein